MKERSSYEPKTTINGVISVSNLLQQEAYLPSQKKSGYTEVFFSKQAQADKLNS
jgi:hypothetical protein